VLLPQAQDRSHRHDLTSVTGFAIAHPPANHSFGGHAFFHSRFVAQAGTGSGLGKFTDLQSDDALPRSRPVAVESAILSGAIQMIFGWGQPTLHFGELPLVIKAAKSQDLKPPWALLH
jgi:hypothetical protein